MKFTHHCYTVPQCCAQTLYINVQYMLVSVTISKLFVVIWWGAFPCFLCQIHQIFSVPFLFIFLLLFKRWPSFGFLHDVVAKCTDVSEERTACIFRVTELVKVNALVIQWNQCVSCIRIVGDIWPVTAAEGGKYVLGLSWVSESCGFQERPFPPFSQPHL